MNAPTLAITPLCDLPHCNARPAAGSHLCPQHDPILCVRCVEPVDSRHVVEVDALPHCEPCAFRQTGEDHCDLPCDGELHYTGRRDPSTNEDVETGPCPIAGAR